MAGRRRVAVVTGSNKGIGFGMVRELCKQFDGDVFLTARDVGRGEAAVKLLESEGLCPKFHQLDVTDKGSITRLKNMLSDTYQGLDLLVNNAAIASQRDVIHIFKQLRDMGMLEISDEYLQEDPNSEPFGLEAAETIKVNYTSQVQLCKILFPLLRPHARVCDVSSYAAKNSFDRCSDTVQQRLENPAITLDMVTELMNEYVEACQDGTHLEKGFDFNAYGFSKIGFTLMSALHQQQLTRQGAEDIVVNSCSPGFVNTDMTRGKGFLSVEEGIKTPLYLCLLPPDISSPRGKFLRGMEIADLIKLPS